MKKKTTNKKSTDKSESEGYVPEIELGGLFRGLGDFVNMLGKIVKTGESLKESEGEFRIKGLGDNARGVYGFSVTTGIEGTGPRVQPFGNVRNSKAGLVVDEVREPLVNIFDEDREIVITAELPGVLENEIVINFEDEVLIITTSGDQRYATEIPLSDAVLAKSLRQSYNNGVLEIRFQKVATKTESGENDS